MGNGRTDFTVGIDGIIKIGNDVHLMCRDSHLYARRKQSSREKCRVNWDCIKWSRVEEIDDSKQ